MVPPVKVMRQGRLRTMAITEGAGWNLKCVYICFSVPYPFLDMSKKTKSRSRNWDQSGGVLFQ